MIKNWLTTNTSSDYAKKLYIVKWKKRMAINRPLGVNGFLT